MSSTVIETPDDWRRPPPTLHQQRIDVYIGLAVAVVALFHLTLGASVGFSVMGHAPGWPEQLFWSLAVTLPF